METNTRVPKQPQLNINHEAPVVQTREITIHATSEKVWNMLTNIENWDKWNKRITKPVLKGDLKEGAAFVWKTNGSRIRSKIHTLKINEVLGWTGNALGANAIHNWYLEPIEEGTKVRVEESMDGWLIILMKKIMNEKLATDMEYWLEQLKIESEKYN